MRKSTILLVLVLVAILGLVAVIFRSCNQSYDAPDHPANSQGASLRVHALL